MGAEGAFWRTLNCSYSMQVVGRHKGGTLWDFTGPAFWPKSLEVLLGWAPPELKELELPPEVMAKAGPEK